MSSNGIQRGSGEAREVDGEHAAGGSTHGAAAGDGLPVMPRAEHPPIPGQPAPATRTPTPARRVEPVSGDGSPAGAVSRDGSPASAARHFAEPVAGHPADLVVVGVDGSLGSGDAVDSAAQQAARRHATLRLVHANTAPVVGEAAHRRSAEDVDRPARVVGQALLEEVRAGLRGSDPALGVETRLVPGDPVTVLRGESEHARLTVVGALGAGRAAGRLLGSVAVAISDLNSAPVAVIHPHHRNAGRGPVVVGVDGSPASDAAVEFAFEEAAMRRADLLAVHAWHDEAVDTTVGDHRRFTDPGSHRGNRAGAAVGATGRMVEQVPGRRRAPDGGTGPIGAGVVGVRERRSTRCRRQPRARIQRPTAGVHQPRVDHPQRMPGRGGPSPLPPLTPTIYTLRRRCSHAQPSGGDMAAGAGAPLVRVPVGTAALVSRFRGPSSTRSCLHTWAHRRGRAGTAG